MSAKKGLIAALIVAVVLVVVLLSYQQPTTPEGLPVIDTLQSYRDQIASAHELSKDLFAKVDAGEELTEAEKAQLLKAAQLIDNANRFLPNRVVPFLGAGKSYQFADQLELAQARYEQCLANVPYEIANAKKKSDTAAEEVANNTAYEAHYRLSQVSFKKGDYAGALAQADRALEGHPDGVDYLVARANALIQLRRTKEAKQTVEAALLLEADNKRALGLKKLLETR